MKTLSPSAPASSSMYDFPTAAKAPLAQAQAILLLISRCDVDSISSATICKAAAAAHGMVAHVEDSRVAFLVAFGYETDLVVTEQLESALAVISLIMHSSSDDDTDYARALTAESAIQILQSAMDALENEAM